MSRQYNIIRAQTAFELENLVNAKIREGLIPLGSMVVECHNGTTWYYQPMWNTKEAPDGSTEDRKA